MADTEQVDLTTLTVELLSAFVSNNSIESADLPALIQSTHSALAGINAAPAPEPEKPEFTPAVSVRKSLSSPDHLISMIDGKPYKMLKRHLSTNGLTPAEYRTRYGLPKDYPMVSKNYSDARRAVAEKLGLGRKLIGVRSKADEAVKPTAVEAEQERAGDTPANSATTRKAQPKTAKAKPVRVAKVKSAPISQEATASTTSEATMSPVAATPAPKKTRAAAKKAAPAEVVTAPADTLPTTPKAKSTDTAKPAAKAKIAAKPRAAKPVVAKDAPAPVVTKPRGRKTRPVAIA